MMSFAHMHAFSYATCLKRIPNAEIVGVADGDTARVGEMAKQLETKAFKSYGDLLKQDIDAVVICCENIYHRELTEMAAEAKKHIMCEKPLATTIADGRAMIEVCKKNGVQLQTAFPCRYSPAMIEGRKTIREGGIGQVLAIKGTNHGMCPGGWFTDTSLSGGGAVIDHTVHVADLMRWTIDAEVTEVQAEISNLMIHKNFDDTGILSIQFNNGVFATLDCSWSRPPSYSMWGDVAMFVLGSEGSVNIDELNQKMNVYNDRVMRHTSENWGDNTDLALCKGFVDAIATGSPVPITGEDGLAAAAVALAAYESAKRAGQVVKMEEIGY